MDYRLGEWDYDISLITVINLLNYKDNLKMYYCWIFNQYLKKLNQMKNT